MNNKPDFIFCTTGRHMTSLATYFYSMIFKLRYYVDFRDIFSESLPQLYGVKNKFLDFGLRRFFLFFEKKVLKRASGVNVVSKAFLSYYQEEGLDTSGWSFFPNGVDNDFLDIKNLKNVDNQQTVILYAGNIGKGQGLEKIVPPVAKSLGNNFLFIIIGDGVSKLELSQAIQKNSIDNVKLINPMKRSELIAEYLKADILFLQLNTMRALKRSLPSKLFEYAVIGKPIVGGLSGYSRRFLKENVPHALVFEPGNVEQCYATIKMANNIKVDEEDIKKFKEKFSRETIMDSMVDDIFTKLDSRL